MGGGRPGLEFIALTLEPVSKIYVEPVAVLDFQSLYQRLSNFGFVLIRIR